MAEAWRRDTRLRRCAVALVSVLAVLGGAGSLRVASAQWTATTSLPATMSAAAAFPGLPELVGTGGPVFFHRGEETADTPAATVAEDSSVHNQDGGYSAATDGSSLWWRLDEDTNATSWSDASGTTNTGGPSGTPSTITNVGGPTGGGLLLGATTATCCYHSGAGAAAVSARLSPFSAKSSFTVSMWAYVGTMPTGTARAGLAHVTNSDNPRSDVVLNVDASATNCPVAPCWTFTMAKDPTDTSVGWDTVYGPQAVANTWTQLTGVFNPSTPLTAMTLYVNGARQGTPVPHVIPATASTDRNIGFGRYRNGNWLGYGGETLRIGEPRTWRRAISAVEAQQLSVRPTSRYTFNEAAGTTPRYSTSSTASSYLTATTAGPGPAVSGYSSTGVTLGADATLAAGREDNALTMSTAGATGYLQGPASQLTTGGDFSVAAWVRLTDAGADRTIISQNASTAAGATPRFVVGYEKAANKFFFKVWQTNGGATATTLYSTVSPVVGQWMHVAVAFEAGAQMRLYINGAGAPSGASQNIAFAGWAPTGTVQVGRQLSAGATVAPWQGQIDDLRIYNGHDILDSTMKLLVGGIGADPPGGLNGSTKNGHAGSVAMAFGGSSNGYNSKYAATAATGAFTVECLVRVAPGDSGVIAGFAPTSATLDGATSDRLLYIDSTGKVRFGVRAAGTPVTVVSAAAIDTGAWFHVMGSAGARGLILAVTPATLNPTPAIVTHTPPPAVTAAVATTGYWRWGGAPLLPAGAWPAAPQNPHLTGTIDEFVVYDKQLTEQELYWRVYANY